MRRAPVDVVDAQIEVAQSRLHKLCLEMASLSGPGPLREALQSEVTKLAQEIGLLRFKREEVIRETFYR